MAGLLHDCAAEPGQRPCTAAAECGLPRSRHLRDLLWASWCAAAPEQSVMLLDTVAPCVEEALCQGWFGILGSRRGCLKL